MSLTNHVLMPGSDYQDICDAIREKTGITGDLISNQLGNIIRSIQGSVVLPTHTINFYNDTTLLQSYANVVYGSTVTYTGETPTKTSTATMSYTFDRFEPSGARITGDTNCYAQFIETVIGGGDDEEVTYEWVPMAIDGVSYMGEEVTIPHANKVGISFEYVISETDQYRVTINGAEYTFSLGDEGMVQVAAEDNNVIDGLWIVRNDNSVSFQRYDGLVDVTTTIKFESLITVSTEEEPTAGEWVPFCADDTTWTGEEIDIANTGKGVRPAQYSGTVIISPTNQYRFTLDDGVYEGVNISEDASLIRLENCPYQLQMYSDTDHRFNFMGTGGSEDLYYTGTLKVESWTGSEPYVPEEEGYVPTDGYQAFTTDGTWTGEEVTTAVATTDFTRYTAYADSDIKYHNGSAIGAEPVEGTEILLTINGEQYLCSGVIIGSPKTIYRFTCDGCPASLVGGDTIGDSWALAFSTAGTYTVKVEAPVT